ncbi:chorismate mutase family protein [Kitasatospora sp. NPDC002227]|uniref:chorismate mutase family protein n=1 Tax=Kitasatospora sp. NPDC002227 TaxID=3154773 RepID=UPI00332864E6
MPRTATGVGRIDKAGSETLEELRSELDAIDGRLLEELRARIEICVEIAHVKRAHDVPMMQPHRIGIVQERAAKYAAQHGMSGTFLRGLYELIIAETCRVEDLIIDSPEADAEAKRTNR